MNSDAGCLRNLLVRLSRAMLLLEKSEVGCCGLTLAQCHMLVETVRARTDEPASVGDVAQAVGVKLSTASRVADGLVRKRLLHRQPSKMDRRRSVLTPTAEGRRLVDAIDRGMDEYAEDVLTAVPAAKRRDVLSSLELLVGKLEQARSCCADRRPPRSKEAWPQRMKMEPGARKEGGA